MRTLGRRGCRPVARAYPPFSARGLCRLSVFDQGEAEAVAPDGFDGEPAAPLPELAAQALDQVVGGAGVGLPVDLPEVFQQLLPADGGAVPPDQVGQEIELRGREGEGLIVQRCAAGAGVQAEGTEAEQTAALLLGL